MAGGTFGFDPLQAMLMRIQQQPQNEEQYASGATPISSPTAPPPAPVAGPSGGGGPGAAEGSGAGGGLSSLLSSLSGAVGNIASGSGLFGDTSRDAETDPSSGAPLGMVRKANGQRMMNLGVMLLAAGGRQSDDSRARILASIPGQLGDPGSQLNEFAKTRLDMAKTRLIERTMIQEEEKNRVLNAQALRAHGMNPDATPIAGSGPASTTPSANAPVVAAAVPGAIGQQAAAASGGGGSGPLVVGTPGPATPSAGQPAPLSGQPAPLSGQPAPAGSATLPVGVPPPIPRRIWHEGLMSPSELQSYIEMKPDKKLEFRQKQQETLDKQEMTTASFIDPKDNKIKTHTYQNGLLARVGSLGEAPGQIKRKDENGRTIIEEYDAGGRLKGVKFDDDPAVQDERKFIAETAKGLQKEHRETILPAATSYEKLTPLIEAVKKGEGYIGTAAGLQEYAVKTLASFGGASETQIQNLINTSRIRGVSEETSNRFAKAVNGSQVTDEDRNSARAAIGAILTGDKNTLADALERLQEEAGRKVKDYQARQQGHMQAIGRRPLATDVYGAPAIELKPPSAPGTPAPGAAPTPTAGQPTGLIKYNKDTKRFERM